MSGIAVTRHESLKTNLAGMELVSPVLNASGAFNPGLFNELFPLKDVLGGIVTKTVTPGPRTGNPQQRTVELPGIGMLNSIGLQNPGLGHFLDKEARNFKGYGTALILSMSATTTEAFAQMAEAVMSHPDGSCVDALELNLSCPNVAKGVEFSSSPALVKEAVSAVAGVFDRPVFAKLTPNIADMAPVAEGALNGGASGLTAINTVFGAAIDPKARKPVLPRISGGYSGPGIKPVAIHHILRLRQAFPEAVIMGVGGISTATDVLEFMMAGASAVQVGTACFRHPGVFPRLAAELDAFCREEGIQRLSALVGCAVSR